MDFFDELMQEDAATPEKELDFFDELEAEESEELSVRMRLAQRKSPEEAANHYSVSDKTGLPVDYIERNPEIAKQEFDYDALRKRSPLLADMLRDQRNAEIAQKELDNLSWFEEAARETKNVAKMVPAAITSIGSAGYGVLSSAASAIESIPRIPLYGVEKALEAADYQEAAKSVSEFSYDLSILSRAFGYVAEDEAKVSQSYFPKPNETRIHPAVLGGVQSAIVNIPALAASVATKNPNVGLSLMGGVSYGGSYAEAKSEGLSDFEAFTFASNNAIAEVVTEKLPLGKLLQDIDNNTGFVKLLGKQMLAEGLTEQAATVWQDAAAWASINPEKTLQEFKDERGDAAVNTMISTIVATGLQTSAIAGLNKLASNQEQDVVDSIVEKANESNYRELDKQNFESYLQEVSEEYGAVDYLYIDAEAASQALEEMQEDDAYQLIVAQLEEATTLNGDIVIPVGQFASTVATSPNYEVLKGSIRVTPDADTVTVNAAQQIQEAYQNIENKDESKRIFNEIAEQIKSTGVLTPEQAKLSAEIIPAFLGANPERMGLTIPEAYEMMGLKVIGPTQEIEESQVITLINSLKSGDVSRETQELAEILESQDINLDQTTEEIAKQLSGIKEFKQKPVTETTVKSDPLEETSEWRDQDVTATLDDGTQETMKAGEAYDIIQKRKKNAESILECLNANT